MLEKRINVDYSRIDISCATIWTTTKYLMERPSGEQDEFCHRFMSVLVFCAFTVEAYLNDIGREIAEDWEAFERLRPLDKYEYVLKNYGLKADFEKEPDQIIKSLFSFRNDIAHGKTETSNLLKRNVSGKKAEDIRNRPPDWVGFCSKENAEKAMKVVEERTTFLDTKLGRNLPTLSVSAWIEGCDTLVE